MISHLFKILIFNSKTTRADLSSATYSRAVLWESLRLSPVAVGELCFEMIASNLDLDIDILIFNVLR